MPKVEFRNITKQYGKLTVIRGLELTIADGEFVVLLGPSGCGKTTLLNILAGLQEVTAGEVLIDGTDVTDFDPKDRGLAMVFQSYALYPTKTVRENLKFGLAAQKLNRAEVRRRVEWVADLLQIRELMDRKPAQLSGGQRQRVAIGRALVKNVGLFLFDEPLSNLDAKLRSEMHIEIKRLHEELASTVVYVTHDQIEAMTMATRIAVLNMGVIQQIGSPDEVYETPANLFVAGFIGSPPMNFLNARLERRDSRATATLASGQEIDLAGYRFAGNGSSACPVKLGFRPEHVSIGRETCNHFRLPVRSAERSGSDATIFCEMEENFVAVRATPGLAQAVRPGEEMDISLHGRDLHVFDEDAGQRL